MHPLYKTPLSEIFPFLNICLKQVDEDGRTLHTADEKILTSDDVELSDCSSQANIDQRLAIHDGGAESDAIEEEKKQTINVGNLDE